LEIGGDGQRALFGKLHVFVRIARGVGKANDAHALDATAAQRLAGRFDNRARFRAQPSVEIFEINVELPFITGRGIEGVRAFAHRSTARAQRRRHHDAG
jgi:hypothetical protein